MPINVLFQPVQTVSLLYQTLHKYLTEALKCKAFDQTIKKQKVQQLLAVSI